MNRIYCNGYGKNIFFFMLMVIYFFYNFVYFNEISINCIKKKFNNNLV